MPQAIITVAGITPPAIGKKQGHIIDTTGGKWNVWGDKLQNYRIGVTYDITYEENEFNNAKFYVIKTAEPSGQAIQHAAPMGRQQTIQPPQGQAFAQHPNPPSMPVQQLTMKDEMIFVCGAVNNMLANPNTLAVGVTPLEMTNFINMCRMAWKQTFGGGQQPRADMGGDQIPF